MQEVVEWLDLSAHGAKLSVLRFPDSRTRIVLSGVKDGSASWRWAENNGFVASPNRLSLISADTKISFTKFLAHFTQGKRAQIPRNQLIRLVTPDNIRSVKADVELRTARVLGLNHLGQHVFEGVAGRFVRSEEGDQPINERESQPAVFLRAVSPEAMALCAEGLVEMMVRGEIMRANDLRRFAGVVYGLPAEMGAEDVRLRTVQEAVEAAQQRRLEKTATQADREAFDWAVMLAERQPPFIFRTSSSIENQQYSTVLPLAVAVQSMLGNTQGLRVLEPTIGNASLVSILPAGTEITGYDIDPARVAQASMLRDDIVAKEADFTHIDTAHANKYDIVVANPPFGGLNPNQEMEGLRISRLDHLILMKGLEARKDDGRAVFIIGADRENLIEKNAGKISGGSKNLFNWLADHYELEGVAEVDGRLYEKQGAGYPVRLVVVGPRRSPIEAAKALHSKAFRLGETIPVLRSWEEVWGFAETHKPQAKVAIEVEHQTVEIVENSEDLRSNNSYQTPYVASSKIGESSAMIPRNMQAPIAKALDELEQEYGTIDDFVANKLQMTMTDLAQAFSPEQVDSIALAIARVEEGRGFIVGDQTGLGKGRQMAAMARYAAVSNRHIIFLTEKPNLFTDLWRDIRDICVDMDPTQIFKPLIVNDGAGIRDQNNKIIFPATKKETLKKLIDDNIHPADAGYSITFATYSQFNRELAKSPKAGWLGNAASQSIILLDESHNAAGASNTADNIAAAVAYSWGCVYSSATFAKNAKNMAAYSKVFPSTISMGELPDILAAGGEPLQEILAALLVEDGAMIRREHDLSALTFETLQDKEHFERNRAMSDQLSNILLAMSFMAGDVSRLCKRLNTEIRKDLEKLSPEQRKGNRMGVQSVNFGSRLYNILRQFQLSIKVDATADLAIAELNAGRKPVIVTEQTMESLLAETLLNIDPEDDEGENFKLTENVQLEALTFRDVLNRVLDKIDSIVERTDYGTVIRTTAIQKAENKDQAEAWAASKDRIRKLIEAFPDLPVSPLDTIREKIVAAGFSCGEISGRKLQVNSTLTGGITVTPRPDDRLKTIHGFNNGAIDAVILTRAGSTGISLHASEKFEDLRQRVMIELQIPNNVAERMQFFGRVNRKGQVSSPIIYTLASGLPSEMRVLAMQNAKLRKLSANTQSNRENIASAKDIADILNPLGNEVVFRFLENNPSVANRLDIDLDRESEVDDIYFVNRLTGWIALLPVHEQEEILDLINMEFLSTLADLDKAGMNPFKLSENDWKARLVSREIFDGAENPDASVFEKPVYLSQIEWEEHIDPMQWKHVESLTLHNIEELLRDGRAEAVPGKTVNGFPMVNLDKLVESVSRTFDQIIIDTLPHVLDEKKEIRTLEDALAAEGPNSIKGAYQRRNFLVQFIRSFRPGRMVRFIGDDGEMVTGMVAGFRLPEDERYEHLLGKYEVLFAVPGEARPQCHSVYSLQQQGNIDANVFPRDDIYNYREKIEKRFEEAPGGVRVRSRLVLDGNLFRAAQLATQMGVGRSGIYTDHQGNRQRGIIMGVNTDIAAMKAVAPRLPSAALASEILHTMSRIELSSTPNSIRNETATLRAKDITRDAFMLTVPGAKQTGGKYFLDKPLMAITGEFAGNRSQMSVEIPAAKLDAAMVEIFRISGGLYAPAKLREIVNEMQARGQTQQVETPAKAASPLKGMAA